MAPMVFKVVTLLLLGALLPAAQAQGECKDWNVQIVKLENCGSAEPQAIKMINSSFNLDEDCNAKVSGCVEITQDITDPTGLKAEAKAKGAIPFAKVFENFCTEIAEAKEEDMAMAEPMIRAMYPHEYPPKCPLKAGVYCAPENAEKNFAEYKKHFQKGKGKHNGEATFTVGGEEIAKICAEVEVSGPGLL